MPKALPTFLLFLGFCILNSCKKDTAFVPSEPTVEPEFFFEGTVQFGETDSMIQFQVGIDPYTASSIVSYNKDFTFLFAGISQLNSRELRLGSVLPFPIYGAGFKINFADPGFIEKTSLSEEEIEELIRPGFYEVGDLPNGVEIYLDLSYFNDLQDSLNNQVTYGLMATTHTVYKPGTFEILSIEEFTYQPQPDTTIYGKKVEVAFDCEMQVYDGALSERVVLKEGHGVFFMDYIKE